MSCSDISGNQLRQVPNLNASSSLLNLDVSNNPILTLQADFYSSTSLKYFK
jgi:Leucine-rich repeat (LRR) protein